MDIFAKDVINLDKSNIFDGYDYCFLGHMHKMYGKFEMEDGAPVYLGKVAPKFNMGWNNSISYKALGLSFLINARFGGLVTSSAEAILDRYRVSQRSADERDNGGLCSQVRVE